MRVFVTGATGFIGTAVVEDLLRAGHQVLGLARSDAGAEALIAAGAEVQRGDLEDLESLRSGAAQSDGVIHTAFNHDFSKFQANCEMDRTRSRHWGTRWPARAGHWWSLPGFCSWRPAAPQRRKMCRLQSLLRTLALRRRLALRRWPRVYRWRWCVCHRFMIEGRWAWSVMRSPLPRRRASRRMWVTEKPLVCGTPAGCRARLPVGFERAAANGDAKGTGIARYHAVAEEGVSVGEIAEAIGRGLKIPVKSISPEEAGEHFGFLGFFVGFDGLASSALTQQWLGWRPTQGGLLTDLEHARDFEA